MSSLLTILLVVIFLACVGVLYPEGMWSNAIRLINVVTAALLATNFWEPAAKWLDDWNSSYTYFWDFIAIWGLFAFFMVVLRALTDSISKVKVRFLNIADRVGSGLFAAWVGWVMVCFTLTTLHMAPLSRNFLFDGFQPEQRMFIGMAPDRKWLGFTQKMSLGTFCRSATEEEWQREKYVFDPQSQFMPKYATRRANLEGHVGSTGTFRVNAGQ